MAKAYQIWDSMQRGLALRVQVTGAKSWIVVYSRQGRSRWYTLGSADSIGLAAARMLATEIMLEVARGKDPAAERKAERSKGTFEELAERYVDEYAKTHNKSWKQAAALVRCHVLPHWAKLQAASITRSDVKDMMTRIEAPIAANQTLAAVSAIFSWAVEEDIVTANPCKLVERNPTRSRNRVLAASEVPVFWKALADIDPVEAAALKVLLRTGQRPGEISHMRREHIKDGGWWELPGEEVPEFKVARHQKRQDPPRVAAESGAGPDRRRLKRASCSPVCGVVRSITSIRRCARSAASSASSGRRRTICAEATAAALPPSSSAATP